MKYKSTIRSMLTILLTLFSTQIFAANVKEKNLVCPSINVIQKFNFISAGQYDDHGETYWEVNQLPRKFDTNQSWRFYAFIKAYGYFDALNKAHKTLPELRLTQGPVEGGMLVACYYDMGGYRAVALTVG